MMRTTRMVIAFCVGMLLAGAIANAWGNGNHDRNSHPKEEQPHGDNTADSMASSDAVADSQSVAGALATGGTGGEGGAGGHADAFGEGGTGTGGSSGGNTFKGSDNKYFSLSVGAPNISECIVGGSAGGGDGGGGGLFQWGRLNHDCFMDQISNGERHIETRATLKCGSAKVRRAIAYKTPRAGEIEKTTICIEHFVEIWGQEIDYLRELVTTTSESRNHELELIRLEALLNPK